jgi:hypothetical protein
MSSAAVTPQQDWFAVNAPKAAAAPQGDWFAQNAPKSSAAAKPPDSLDKEIPLDSHVDATLSGLQSVGRGVRSAFNGTLAMLDPRTDASGHGYKEGLSYPFARVAQGVEDTAKQVPQVPSAIRTINASPDPLGTYLKVGQETAGQGAGQALLALGTEGAVKAAPVVADAAGAVSDTAKAAATRMAERARTVTPKQAAQTVGAASGAVGGHGWLSPVGAAFGIKTFGDVAEILLGKERANLPIFQKAASLDEAADGVAQTIAKNRTQAPGAAPSVTVQDRAAAQSLVEDALKQHSSDVIDNAIPGKNSQAKGAIDYYLRKGDVANAERVLDKSAKAANPAWQPLDRQPVPSTNEIRARVQADAKTPQPGSAADVNDDRALQQEMQWNLQRHGWAAESEARREFIARNSTGTTKGELTKRFRAQSAKPSAASAGTGSPAAGSATATAASDDLTEMLQKSLDQVRAQSAQK